LWKKKASDSENIKKAKENAKKNTSVVAKMTILLNSFSKQGASKVTSILIVIYK